MLEDPFQHQKSQLCRNRRANNAATFYKESQSTPHQEIRISRDLFVGITKGQFPLVLLFDGDSVVSSFSTNVSEKELQDFLPCDTKE